MYPCIFTSMIARTPPPPYYAVIFTTRRTDRLDDYEKTAARMVELAQAQPGFLGIESAYETVGLTVSYWKDLESIRLWKHQADHTAARKKAAPTGIGNIPCGLLWWKRNTVFQKSISTTN